MGLGASLGLAVIAEGVERTAEAGRLKALGGRLAQGYLYGLPLPASALGYVPRTISVHGSPCWCRQRPEARRSGPVASDSARVAPVVGSSRGANELLIGGVDVIAPPL